MLTVTGPRGTMRLGAGVPLEGVVSVELSDRRGESREGVVGDTASFRGDPLKAGLDGSRLFWNAECRT